MRDFHPQVGDKVRVRQWEDMKNEFSEDDIGMADVDHVYFVPAMRYLCGLEFVIEEIDGDVVHGHGDPDWGITISMIEPVAEETEGIYDAEETGEELQTFLNEFKKI